LHWYEQYLLYKVDILTDSEGEKGVGTSGKKLHYKGSTFHRVIARVNLDPALLSKHIT